MACEVRIALVECRSDLRSFQCQRFYIYDLVCLVCGRQATRSVGREAFRSFRMLSVMSEKNNALFRYTIQ